MVKCLVDEFKCCWLSNTGFRGKSILHFACKGKHVHLIHFLITKHNLDPSAKDNFGNSPLHIASACGQVETARHLILKYKVKIDEVNHYKETPLCFAAKSGYIDMVKCLVEEFKCSCFVTGYKGKSLLHYTCESESIELMKRFLTEYNLKPSAKDDIGNTPLHIAAACGRTEMVRHLIIQYKSETEARNHYNETSLCLAVKRGHIDMVRCLVDEFKCNCLVTGSRGKSLLHYACESGCSDILNLLTTEYNLDSSTEDDFGCTPLRFAATHGLVKMVRSFLSANSVQADVHKTMHAAAAGGQISVVRIVVEEYSCNPSIKDSRGQTLLHKVCENGNINLMDILIREYKLDPESKDNCDETPLHVAARRGKFKVVKHLIMKYNVETLSVNNEGCTPLCLASTEFHVNTMKILITNISLSHQILLNRACQKGQNNLIDVLCYYFEVDLRATDCNGCTPLHIAAQIGQAKTVRHLISRHKVKIDACTNKSDTPLSLASLNGHIKVVQMLIDEFNCSPSVKVLKGQTLLHCACQNGHIDLIDFLITRYNLDPSAKDDDGNTTLHTAAACGQIETVRHLIIQNNIVEINTCNHCNEIPLCLAAKSGHTDVVKCLVDEFDCKCWITGFEGKSLLHYACESGHMQLVKLLLDEYELSPLAKEINGRTPLHTAAINGQCETLRYLITELKIEGDVHLGILLHAAATGCHTSVVKMLIEEFHCKPSIKDFRGQTLVHKVCENGDTDLIDILIGKYQLDPASKGAHGETPLHTAARFGNTKAVKHLVTKYNVKTDTCTDRGDTPLCLASKAANYSGDMNFSTAKYLIRSISSVKHETVLIRACEKGQNSIIDILKNDFQINITAYRDDDGYTPLHLAAQSGQAETVRHLISRHKVKIDACTNKSDTPLSLASLNGHIKVVQMLIDEFKCNRFVNIFKSQTILHCACQNGHTDLTMLLIDKYKLSPNAKDDDGNTPLHIAAINGQEDTVRYLLLNVKVRPNEHNKKNLTPLFAAARSKQTQSVLVLLNEFYSIIHIKDIKGHTLLCYVCKKGNISLLSTLLADPQLFKKAQGDESDAMAAIHITVEKGDVKMTRLLMQHQIIKDTDMNAVVIGLAALNGHRDIVKLLINEFHWNLEPMFYNGMSVIHCACKGGNAELVTELLTEYQVGTVMLVDREGNTPLHISVMCQNTNCVQVLLFKHKAPLFARNKLGKTAFDIAKGNQSLAIISVIKEYLQSSSAQIQSTYEELRKQAKQQFNGKKPLTRIFVVGHPGAGKSTLIETLKKEGRLRFVFGNRSTAVLPHTAGIVPSIQETDRHGRMIFYDFAGDREYYSSHAAIMESLDTTEGVNLYLVVCDLSNDNVQIERKYGYWLSFLSNTISIDKVSIVLPVGSHADMLSDQAAIDSKVSLLDRISKQYYDNYSVEKSLVIEQSIALDCQKQGSDVDQIKKLAKKASLQMPPVGLTLGASTLLGLLLKDFSNVTACTIGTVISHIKDTDIALPVTSSLLYPLVSELHNLGLLLLIRTEDSPIDDNLLIMKISTFTSDVHHSLFSILGKSELAKHTDQLKLNVGVIPESLLKRVLPEHITKECLIKLQYCQEIENLLVEEDHTLTQSRVISKHEQKSLLFFPALCEFKLEEIQWPSLSDKHCALGWYVKCADNNFDYFPTRFLHVLIVRLSLKFALKQSRPEGDNLAAENPTLAEVHAFNPCCHVWTSGVHWFMDNGVEVFVDMPKDADSKELIVVTRSKDGCRADCANSLQNVIQTVIEAKAKFCHNIKPSVYLLDPVRLKDEPFTNARNVPLYTLRDVEAAFAEGRNVAISVDGFHCSSPRDLTTLTRWTMSYWSKLPRASTICTSISLTNTYTIADLLFPMSTSDVYRAIEEIVKQWYRLGLSLPILPPVLDAIDRDFHQTKEKKIEMIQEWMTGKNMPTWSSLIEALRSPSIDQPRVADNISCEFSKIHLIDG